MNKIDELFRNKKRNVLSVFFTAGYPNVNDTGVIINELDKAGADIIEIGMPFSDSVVDGPIIQNSNKIALENGMTLKLLFEQLSGMKMEGIKASLMLMGYLNPVMQYGVDKFCNDCKKNNISGVIIPDLPMDIYEKEYREIFELKGIYNIFLITPQTSEERIRRIDEISNGFIYAVSSASITGEKREIKDEQIEYFRKLQSMKLKNPLLIGFGISNNETFNKACEYASGAIIGSAFIKALSQGNDLRTNVKDFISSIRYQLSDKI